MPGPRVVKSKKHSLKGEIEYHDQQIVRGWALDTRSPQRPVALQVFESNTLVGELRASVFRWDLMSRFGTGGCHGFIYRLPEHFLANGGGSFEFQFRTSGKPLDNCPVEVAPVDERLEIPFETTNLTGDRVLVLAPHPDDESLACGGSLILHAENRDPVKIVFLTDGSQADVAREHSRTEYIAMRRKEATEACEILGISDFDFWDIPDRTLISSPDALDRLCDLLRTYSPGLIYAPSPLEYHPDHRAAANLVWKAAERTQLDATIAFCEFNQPIRVNTLVDISAVVERKSRACAAYASQLRQRPYADVSLSLSRFRALTVSPEVEHAEGFFVLSSREISGRPVDWFTTCQHLGLATSEVAENPLVSIIVRTKDRPTLLREALSSILTQTYSNLEVLIINAGTVDVSRVVSEFENLVTIRQIHPPEPVGKAAAANLGAKNAAGKYLNFLDDDDLLYSTHIEKLVRFLEVTGERMAYSDCEKATYEWQGGRFQLAAEKTLCYGTDYDRDRLYLNNYIPFMTAVFQRSLAEEVQYFDESLDGLEDWDFWLRASKLTDFHRIPGVTAQYRFLAEHDYRPHALRIYQKHVDDWIELAKSSWPSRIEELQNEKAKLNDGWTIVEDGLSQPRDGEKLIDVLVRAQNEVRTLRKALTGAQNEIRNITESLSWRAIRLVPDPLLRVLKSGFEQIEGLWSSVLAAVRGSSNEDRARLHGALAATQIELLSVTQDKMRRTNSRRDRLRLPSSRMGPPPGRKSEQSSEERQPARDRWQGPAINTHADLGGTAETVVSERNGVGDEYIVRSFRTGDEHQILKLFETCFGVPRGKEHWEWKYLNNPWGGRKISLAFASDGNLVAHYSGYPSVFYDANSGAPKELLGLQIGDTMTAPRARQVGRRSTTLLHRVMRHHFAHFCENHVGLNYGFNTGKIQRYYLRLVEGSQFFEAAPFMVLDLKGSAASALHKLSVETRYDVTRVLQIDEQWATLFDRVAVDYGMLVRRDTRYVLWRYLECPDVDYRLYAIRYANRLVGWSVFRQQDDKLIWGDGLFDRAHPDAFGTVLACVLERPEHASTRQVEGWFSARPEWWRDVIRGLGFEDRPEPDRLGMIYKPFVAPDPGVRFRSSLYYTKGDSDLF